MLSSTAASSSSCPSSDNAVDLDAMSRDELLNANRRLQAEVGWIKSKLVALEVQQKMSRTNDAQRLEDDEGAQRAAEVQNYANQLRIEGATIIRQNEELLGLRQRCALYAATIEETTSNFEQLKQLFAQLAPLVSGEHTAGA